MISFARWDLKIEDSFASLIGGGDLGLNALGESNGLPSFLKLAYDGVFFLRGNIEHGSALLRMAPAILGRFARAFQILLRWVRGGWGGEQKAGREFSVAGMIDACEWVYANLASSSSGSGG